MPNQGLHRPGGGAGGGGGGVGSGPSSIFSIICLICRFRVAQAISYIVLVLDP